MCDAVVCVVSSNLQVSTVVHELQEFITRTAPPLCVVLSDGGSSSADIKTQLTSVFPQLSMNPDRIVVKDVSMTVRGGFEMKRILDSNKISNFVVITTEENLENLLVVMEIIFTTAYQSRVRTYGESQYANIPAILTNVSEDLKRSLKKDCCDYLSTYTSDDSAVEIVKSDKINDEVFAHGFSTRKGGCSIYPSVSSLNLAFIVIKKDPPIVVEENRRRLLQAVGTPSHKFHLAKAVHGNTVWMMDDPEPTEGYDAIVCDKPGTIIAAPAADCVTLVLGDASKSVCAAIHSGWKGTLANVIGLTIETMKSHFGCKVQDIRAAIGPSIGACCYEIGADVEKLFVSDSLLGQCLKTVEGKAKKHLNLQKALRLQLEEVGISSDHIDDSPSKLCTYCNKDKFYSYRRDGRPFGTHVGFIGLR